MKPDYNFFLEDYFSMILAQLYAIKFKKGFQFLILLISICLNYLNHIEIKKESSNA